MSHKGQASSRSENTQSCGSIISNLPAQSHTYKTKWVQRKFSAVRGHFLFPKSQRNYESIFNIYQTFLISLPLSRMNIVLGLLYGPSWLCEHVMIGDAGPEYLPRVCYHGMPNINFAGPLLLKMQLSARNLLVDAFKSISQSQKHIYRFFFLQSSSKWNQSGLMGRSP
jgi:hypothetical protein